MVKDLSDGLESTPSGEDNTELIKTYHASGRKKTYDKSRATQAMSETKTDLVSNRIFV